VSWVTSATAKDATKYTGQLRSVGDAHDEPADPGSQPVHRVARRNTFLKRAVPHRQVEEGFDEPSLEPK
jgi:hypothetical protein